MNYSVAGGIFRFCPGYRRPAIIVKVLSPLPNDSGRESARLTPVLYHGTCRIVVELWRIDGLGNNSLSLDSDLFSAVRFASYGFDQKGSFKDRDNFRLQNDPGRSIAFFRSGAESLGLAEEYARIKEGRTVNAVAFFDRDSLLEEAGGIQGLRIRAECDSHDQEEGGYFTGIKIRQSGIPPADRLSNKALFASLELDMKAGAPDLRVFNRQLWERNFSAAVPRLSSLRTFSGMLELAKSLPL